MQVLNEAQARHLAGSLRATGLGQLAAFAYSGIQVGQWQVVVLSVSWYLLAEGAAILLLKDVEGIV